MNDYTRICNLNMRQNFVWVSVLIVTMVITTSFGTHAFAEELYIQKPELSIGANHLGSMIKTQTVSNDGSIWIFVTSTEPVEREHMTLNVEFTDKNGKRLYNVNYDILVSQNGQVILDKTMVNHQIGIGDHLTQALPSNDNVSVKITLQGIGTDSFTGAKGESIQINMVPEFGTIAMMILVVSIISIIAITAKSKVMFKSFTYK